MGEVVQRHMESTINEIQEMRRIKLYSPIETEAILKARRAHEEKINGPVKNPQDFKHYIKFEQDILRDIKLRRHKMKIAERKSAIEVRILKRIKYIYEIAIQRFSNDFEFSLSFFNFCKEANFNQSASLVIQNILKNFSHIPDVWKVAASWFMKNDVKKALSLIHKGLTIHRCSRELYIQAIELELLTKEKDEWPTDPKKVQKQGDDVCYQKIETYVEAMFQNINNYSCLVTVLKILDKHAFTLNIRNRIINKLMTQYCNDVQVWLILAEREKEGHHYPQVEDTPTQTKFRLERCMEKFEEGLAQICPQKKGAMWSLYLDYLIELNQKNNTVGSNFIRNTLIQKFNEAGSLSLLTEKYYVIWAKLLTEEEEIIKVVEEGLRVLPLSVDLWKLKLRCMIMKDDISEICEEFKKGYFALKEKSGPLWTMIIRYHVLSSPNNIIEEVFKKGVSQQSKEISNLVKPDYIEWVVLNKDIHCAREVYRELAQKPPFCKELHAKMFKLEVNELNIDVKTLELPMKLMCEQFGHEDADVWISLKDIYFQYLHLFQEAYPLFDINEKIREIRMLAEEALKNNAIMWEDFKDKYDTPVNMDYKL